MSARILYHGLSHPVHLTVMGSMAVDGQHVRSIVAAQKLERAKDLFSGRTLPWMPWLSMGHPSQLVNLLICGILRLPQPSR